MAGSYIMKGPNHAAALQRALLMIWCHIESVSQRRL